MESDEGEWSLLGGDDMQGDEGECCLLSGDDIGDEEESGPPCKRARADDSILDGGLSPDGDADDDAVGGDLPSSLAHKLSHMRPFQWAPCVLECFVHLLGHWDIKNSLLVSSPSLSTHFSGVGTAEKAAKYLEAMHTHECSGICVGG